MYLETPHLQGEASGEEQWEMELKKNKKRKRRLEQGQQWSKMKRNQREKHGKKNWRHIEAPGIPLCWGQIPANYKSTWYLLARLQILFFLNCIFILKDFWIIVMCCLEFINTKFKITTFDMQCSQYCISQRKLSQLLKKSEAFGLFVLFFGGHFCCLFWHILGLPAWKSLHLF